jgi:UDP-N-acetylglucosamine/UDP-N-acetyl-alpha-D-glucosaminouronate 4-epimerase
MNSRAVAVTGGAGFIGSHLAEGLLKRRYKVIILDDLSTGKLENIRHLIEPSSHREESGNSVEFVRGSITDLPSLKNVFQAIDYVFHEAAIPSVPRSIENPQASHEANITGTLNVLLAAKDNGVKKVIYASSSSAYGDTPTLPKTEDMSPNPQSPYAVTKLAGEYYCQVFQQVYGLSTVCLRYFNVYGPRQDPGSQYAAVIPRFIQKVLDNKPPIIFGDGEQTRDFTFIKDVVDVNILAAESDAVGVYNIGRGERVSINRLAELVIKFIGNSVEPVHEELRSGDIKHSLADISKARHFGYDPKYSLEEGLTETIRAMRGA